MLKGSQLGHADARTRQCALGAGVEIPARSARGGGSNPTEDRSKIPPDFARNWAHRFRTRRFASRSSGIAALAASATLSPYCTYLCDQGCDLDVTKPLR